MKLEVLDSDIKYSSSVDRNEDKVCIDQFWGAVCAALVQDKPNYIMVNIDDEHAFNFDAAWTSFFIERSVAFLLRDSRFTQTEHKYICFTMIEPYNDLYYFESGPNKRDGCEISIPSFCFDYLVTKCTWAQFAFYFAMMIMCEVAGFANTRNLSVIDEYRRDILLADVAIVVNAYNGDGIPALVSMMMTKGAERYIYYVCKYTYKDAFLSTMPNQPSTGEIGRIKRDITRHAIHREHREELLTVYDVSADNYVIDDAWKMLNDRINREHEIIENNNK
jgi:hypothetical protein